MGTSDILCASATKTLSVAVNDNLIRRTFGTETSGNNGRTLLEEIQDRVSNKGLRMESSVVLGKSRVNEILYICTRPNTPFAQTSA